SALQFRDYADRTDVFESAAAITFRNYNLTGTDQPQRLLGMRVSASLFPLLGVHPVAGRVVTAAEDAYGAQHVVVLSQNVAERMYGSAQGSIGKRLQLDGESYEIVGVLPRALEVIYADVEFWTPMAFTPRELNEERRWSLTFEMLRRLRRGVGLAAARATMATMAARMNGSMDSCMEVLGLVIAEWRCQLLIRMAPANLLRTAAIGLDPAVLLFTLAVSVVVGVLFGLAPALEAARKDLAGALKEGGRGTPEASGRQGLRRALVISEIALAIVLLICSGLLLRSFEKLLEVKPGFDPTNVLTAQVSLPRTKYTDEAKIASFSDALLARVSSLPGVLHAAMAGQPPLTPGTD